MKNEIKEILDHIQKYVDDNEYTDATSSKTIEPLTIGYVDTLLLLDYITKLQQEKHKIIHTNIVQKKQLNNKIEKLEKLYDMSLEDDVKESHRRMELEKERDKYYQDSLILAEENEKLEKNYDRIYNENCKLRENHNIDDISLLDENYKLQQENERLKNRNEFLNRCCVGFDDKYEDYKSRCEKAIDKLYCYGEIFDGKILQEFQEEMLNILQGSDKE